MVAYLWTLMKATIPGQPNKLKYMLIKKPAICGFFYFKAIAIKHSELNHLHCRQRL